MWIYRKGMGMGKSVHIPVMLQETLAALGAEGGGKFLDCTLGGAGHARAILGANLSNTLYAIDRDPIAIERAREEFSEEIAAKRMTVVQGAFSDLAHLFTNESFSGILADLGTSVDQLQGDRGFSFNDKGPLDMRMDPTAARSAKQVVNETSERELYAILKRGGVGLEARAVVKAIIAARPLLTTADLAESVRKAALGKTNKGFDPATVTFQAIRIEVNQELDEIDALLEAVKKLLRSKGRLVVISFHSLEDKIVAKKMREWSGADTEPANWPGRHTVQPFGKLLTKKALFPTEKEVVENSKSRSARLRIFERY